MMFGYLIVFCVVLFGLVGVRRLVRPPAVVMGLHPVMVVAAVMVTLYVNMIMSMPKAVVVGVAHDFLAGQGMWPQMLGDPPGGGNSKMISSPQPPQMKGPGHT